MSYKTWLSAFVVQCAAAGRTILTSYSCSSPQSSSDKCVLKPRLPSAAWNVMTQHLNDPDTYRCDNAPSCYVECDGTPRACKDDIFFCNNADVCTLDCLGTMSCKQVSIDGENANKLEVNVDETRNLMISGPLDGEVEISIGNMPFIDCDIDCKQCSKLKVETLSPLSFVPEYHVASDNILSVVGYGTAGAVGVTKIKCPENQGHGSCILQLIGKAYPDDKFKFTPVAGYDLEIYVKDLLDVKFQCDQGTGSGDVMYFPSKTQDGKLMTPVGHADAPYNWAQHPQFQSFIKTGQMAKVHFFEADGTQRVCEIVHATSTGAFDCVDAGSGASFAMCTGACGPISSHTGCSTPTTAPTTRAPTTAPISVMEQAQQMLKRTDSITAQMDTLRSATALAASTEEAKDVLLAVVTELVLKMDRVVNAIVQRNRIRIKSSRQLVSDPVTTGIQHEINKANTAASSAVDSEALFTIIRDLLEQFEKFSAEYDDQMSIAMRHEEDKWVAKTAFKQRRCEIMAKRAYQGLEFKDWYIEEAMVHQAAECLATLTVDHFGCLNDCRQCLTRNDCYEKARQICEWLGDTGCSVII